MCRLEFSLFFFSVQTFNIGWIGYGEITYTSTHIHDDKCLFAKAHSVIIPADVTLSSRNEMTNQQQFVAAEWIDHLNTNEIKDQFSFDISGFSVLERDIDCQAGEGESDERQRLPNNKRNNRQKLTPNIRKSKLLSYDTILRWHKQLIYAIPLLSNSIS